MTVLGDLQRGIKEKIKREIHRFDIFALLKLLYQIGYTVKEISFQSNPELSSASSFCKDIIFSEEGRFPVIIIVNVGLLSASSPLPNFFRKKMESGEINVKTFKLFLSFFDHFILRNLFSMNMPEDNGWFFSDWEGTKREYIQLLGLNSPGTLAHLFQLCFPELKVEVIKFPRVINKNSLSAILGQTYLGKDSFLGENQKITVSSFRVIFTAEEIKTEELEFVPLLIKERIKKMLLPLLVKIDSYMTFILNLKKCKEIAILSPTSYLGYSRLGESLESFQIRLFAGYGINLFQKLP